MDPSGYLVEEIGAILANPVVGFLAAVGFGLFQVLGRKKKSEADFSHLLRDTGQRFLSTRQSPTSAPGPTQSNSHGRQLSVLEALRGDPGPPIWEVLAEDIPTLPPAVTARQIAHQQFEEGLQLFRAFSLREPRWMRVKLATRGLNTLGIGIGRHKFIQFPNGQVWEMGPGPGYFIRTSNNAPEPGWEVYNATRRALNTNQALFVDVQISRTYAADVMAFYERTFGEILYNLSDLNSNYAADSIIYGTGGNHRVKGLGHATGSR